MKANEFKVGDLVVHHNSCSSSMLFKIEDIRRTSYRYGNDWGWKIVHSHMGISHDFRHATPEEIKAGKRLP